MRQVVVVVVVIKYMMYEIRESAHPLSVFVSKGHVEREAPRRCSCCLDLGNGDHADAAAAAIGRRLAHDHLAGGDESVGQKVDDVFLPASPVAGELLPVELVAHDEVAAAAPLEVALLESVVAGHDLGLVLQAGGQEEPVVVVGRELGLAALDRRGRGRGKGHDVCLIDRVLPRGEGMEWRGGCQEQVGAEAVVGVHGRRGSQRQLLIR